VKIAIVDLPGQSLAHPENRQTKYKGQQQATANAHQDQGHLDGRLNYSFLLYMRFFINNIYVQKQFFKCNYQIYIHTFRLIYNLDTYFFGYYCCCVVKTSV